MQMFAAVMSDSIVHPGEQGTTTLTLATTLTVVAWSYFGLTNCI